MLSQHVAAGLEVFFNNDLDLNFILCKWGGMTQIVVLYDSLRIK